MSRLLAPTLGVLLLAALIGCGGANGPSFGDAADTSTSTTSGDTTNTTGGTDSGTTDLRAVPGDYSASFATGTGTTAVTGTGTASAASTGAVTVNIAAANASDAVARTASVLVAADGSATGTVTVGTAAAATITAGSLVKQSTGVYLLTTTFTNAVSAVETDKFTLALTQRFVGANVGTDNQGAAYTGTGTATISGGSVLGLTYTSTRSLVGGITQTHTLSTTLLSNGTFSGSLGLGFNSTPATGTWKLTSAGVLTLKLSYTNPNFVNSSGRSPIVSETLTLTKQ